MKAMVAVARKAGICCKVIFETCYLMKKYAGDDVAVKAAGGIRSFESAKALIEAGATRLGTSCGIGIVNEMKEMGVK